MIRIVSLLMLMCLPAVAMAAEEKPLCKVTGCSNQLCVSSDSADVAGTCEFKAEYGCYQKLGKCSIQPDGHCGWTMTLELKTCVANVASSNTPFSIKPIAKPTAPK